jgi:hypothetical protein
LGGSFRTQAEEPRNSSSVKKNMMKKPVGNAAYGTLITSSMAGENCLALYMVWNRPK